MASQLWQVHAAFAVMVVGWAVMSGAVINIIVAPSFETRRGMAVSWAMNGASAGDVLTVPLLTVLITATGLADMASAVAGMLAVLVPVSVLVLCSKRVDGHEPM